MRYGIIDIGANSVRMSVFDKTEDGFVNILSEKELIGLVGYTEDGLLLQDGVDRVAETLNAFKRTARAIHVERLECFATAGLRNIRNTEAVTREIDAKTGFAVRVITGEEEARLDFLGARKPADASEGLVVDMGGGSTEIIRYRETEMTESVSLSFGSLSLYRHFVSNILPSDREVRHIRHFARKQLGMLKWLPECGGPLCLVGGTARGFARMHRAVFNRDSEELQGYTFDAGDFRAMLSYLEENKKEAMRNMLKVCPERIHTLVPGIVAFSELARIALCTTVTISRSGVREGYLSQLA